MQYGFFQSWNAHLPGKYRDQLFGIRAQEFGHVEMLAAAPKPTKGRGQGVRRRTARVNSPTSQILPPACQPRPTHPGLAVVQHYRNPQHCRKGGRKDEGRAASRIAARLGLTRCANQPCTIEQPTVRQFRGVEVPSDHQSAARSKRLLVTIAAVAVLAAIAVFFAVYFTAGRSEQQRPQEPQPGTTISKTT